jgi:HEAT repeat protein
MWSCMIESHVGSDTPEPLTTETHRGPDLGEQAMQTLPAAVEPAPSAIIDSFRESVARAPSTPDEDRRLARLLDAAARALARRGRPAVPYLIQALGDEDENVRLLAAVACEELGPAAAPAIPALVELLEDRSGSVVPFNAAHALGKIGPEAITPKVLELLGDRDETVRHAVATAVKGVGPGAQAAVPALIESLKTSEDAYAQQALVEALGTVGPAAAAALPLLTAIVSGLRRESRDAQQGARQRLLGAAEKALERIGKASSSRPN